MAKMKKGKGGGDNDLDLDDLEDFGDLGEDMQFGDEAGIDDDNREPSRSKVVTDLAKEAGEGALESVIKNTAKKALPEDYSANYHEAMDLAASHRKSSPRTRWRSISPPIDSVRKSVRSCRLR